MRWANAGSALWCIGLFAAMNAGVAGCARSWPAVQGIADNEFATHRAEVDTVDVLPLDVDFAISSAANAPADEILARFHDVALGTIQAELNQRGYALTAAMDWDGEYVAPDGSESVAIEQQAIVDTTDSLRGYGYAQSQTTDGLLYPYLPHRLGQATGSDTTLYVGGWAFVGKKRTPTGTKVAKGVLIGAVIVVVIIAVVAGADDVGKGLGKGAGAVAKAAGKGAQVMIRSAGHVAQGFGKAAVNSGKVLANTGGRVLGSTARATGRTTLRLLDAFGRSNTHIDIYGGEPDYYERDIPRRGYSRMEIEMTLVDNRDGRTLWHARQSFHASAANAKDTAEVIRRMLATLPAR